MAALLSWESPLWRFTAGENNGEHGWHSIRTGSAFGALILASSIHTPTTMKSLEKLLREQLADMHYAEKHILTRLPKMAEAAQAEELRQAFEQHEAETQEHVTRIEEAFELLGLKPKSKKCEAILGLLEEGDEILKDFKDEEGLDAALICAAQKVEHYEIATYGSMLTWARQLGHEEVANLLEATLSEERHTDTSLTKLAEDGVNASAMS